MEVIKVLGENVYEVRDPLGKEMPVHSTRLRFYSGSDFQLTEEVRQSFINNRGRFYLKEVVGMRFYQGEYYISCIWHGLEDLVPSLEPLSTIIATAPDPVLDYLRKHRNKEPERTILADFRPIVKNKKAV